MAIVVDANVVVVFASGDSRNGVARALVRGWIAAGESLHAPTLLHYEVASGFTRLLAAGTMPPSDLEEAWRTVDALPVTYHSVTDGARVVRIALSLRRASAYDAAYLALAERLGAQLWTFDGPLYRNAVGLGFPVHLAG